jgi:hypothetical protein
MISKSQSVAASTRLLLALLTSAAFLGAGEASGTQLTASWVDNSNGVATTRLERRLGTNVAFAAIAAVPPGAAAYVDASLSPGTTYCYRALAYDADGVSPYSDEVCATSGYDGYELNLTVSKAGDGVGTVASTPAGILCGTGCSATYLAGTSVTLAVTPAIGSTFTGWSGGGCAGTAACTLAGNAAVSVTATFTAVTNTFVDVPPTHPFFAWIEALAAQGITTGCSTDPQQFCPDALITRSEISVFLLRGLHGAGYRPPSATGMFTDVPVTHAVVEWIEQLAREGITSGCGTNPPRYCPEEAVTRGEMAVFLLRAKNGGTYNPPVPTGMFADVPVSHPFAKWIEQLAREGITAGCGPTTYCPDATVTRGQIAIFLVRALNLPI